MLFSICLCFSLTSNYSDRLGGNGVVFPQIKTASICLCNLYKSEKKYMSPEKIQFIELLIHQHKQRSNFQI